MNLITGRLFIRHPDDVKRANIPHNIPQHKQVEVIPDRWSQCTPEEEDDGHLQLQLPVQQQPTVVLQPQLQHPQPGTLVHPPVRENPPQERRQSTRDTRKPERYGATSYQEDEPFEGEDAMLQSWWPNWRQGEWNADGDCGE